MKSENLFLLFGLVILPILNISAGEIDSIYIDETKREYVLHVPASYTGNDSVPLFIGLHFLGSNGSQFETSTKFSELADKHNFIAVYPNGIGGSWNGGGCCNPAVNQNIDDVQFISQLIDTLKANYTIDSSRIFVAGFSNGSIMAYRLANELSDKVAAVGCVAGQSFQDEVNPANPVPIIHFHALDDNAVNFEGGTIESYEYKPVPEVLNTWKGFNNCDSDSVIFRDEDGIKGYLWSSTDNESDIILYTSLNGGHSWTMNPRLGISNLMWEFFETGSNNLPKKYDTIMIDTLKRSYKTHLPDDYFTDVSDELKYPLVLAFHGWHQDADMMEAYTEMSLKANREDFIVSYLNYVGPPPNYSWNYFMYEDKPNDIGFATKVLDTLITQYPVDTSKVYLIGFSDGCGMANRLPFVLSGRIKGIGTVSGMIAFDETVDTYKVPLIHVNYTGDFAWDNIQSTIPYWTELNGCSELADTTVNARGVQGRRWENEDGKNHVALISASGGTHEWVETDYVNATDLIWEFFETGNAIPDVDTPLVVYPNPGLGNNNFDIYPNPARDILSIKSSGSLLSFISMYDNTGRLLSGWDTGKLKPEEVFEIDLTSYPKGLYFLQIASSEGVIVEKVILE